MNILKITFIHNKGLGMDGSHQNIASVTHLKHIALGGNVKTEITVHQCIKKKSILYQNAAIHMKHPHQHFNFGS